MLFCTREYIAKLQSNAASDLQHCGWSSDCLLSFLRGLLVHPRPDFSYLRVDIFERIAQRGQRLEQVVPVKAPEVGGASVPAVLKEGQPGPHSRGPQAPFLDVIGFSECRIDCSARIWNLLSRSRFAPADSLRWTSSLHRSIQRSTFSTCLPRSPS